ncbi:MAG: RelA/SpoT family protein [Candidatus Buchananbacteria bacterium]
MTEEKIKELYQSLLKMLENNGHDDLDLFKLAYEYAYLAHKGQLRASGDPYISHPLAVAQKLAELKLDMNTIIAGILHDIPEDTNYSLKDIEQNFGSEIANLVEGITKLGKIKYRGFERYAENLRKMFIAMSNNIRIILIKFADRIHNLKTLDSLPKDKQKRIALESLEIYAPIAHRLNIGVIKSELEDLSFKYVYPEEFEWINKMIPKEYEAKGKHLEKVIQSVTEKLNENHIPVNSITIQGRTKYLYSLFKKLQKPYINMDMSKVYDLLALRIILSSVADCYTTLGIIHSLYRPVPGRIKDYIAQPKPNGYRSLHTTVFTENGEIVEFQIRTNEMHEMAEFGIAAHWNYKECDKLGKECFKWIDELLKWQKQIKDNEQFLKTVKFDIFQNRIFVFTPRGDVIELPEQASPIDFAYHVHSSLGDKCVGAKVNGQMVNLAHNLKSGDIVEIITDKNRKTPNPDWLEMAKTSMAKNKIRTALNKNKNPAN